MKDDRSWISIVIPIYNAEKYINDCLKSIVAQSFTNYEVILVDDGSTDKSSEICKKICQSDSRFKYHSIDNSGALRARLYGLDKVQGKYFTFCDADDYYVNSRVLESLHDKVSSVTEPFSFMQFGFKSKYNHLSKTEKRVKQDIYIDTDRFYTDEYPALLCSRWAGSHLNSKVWNKIYDSSLIANTRALNTKERVFWGDDQILNMFLLQKIVGAYYLSDAFYVYRQLTGGTGRFSMAAMDDLNTIKTYQLDFLDKGSYSDIERIRKYLFAELAAWSALYIRQASGYLDEKQLRLHIKNMLFLPTFIQARKYYSEHPEAWDEAEMIRKAQIQDYVNYAEKKENVKPKTKLIRCLKQIYKLI